MKGLLIKDFYGLKSFGVTMIILVALYAGIMLLTGDASMFSMVLILLCAMLPITSISLDDQAKWPAYAQCLPVSRAQTVLSKYLLVLLMTVGAILLSIAATFFSASRGPVDWPATLQSYAMSFGATLLVNALSMPAVFKLGAEKARLVIMLVFGIFALLFAFYQTTSDTLVHITRYLQYLLPVAGVVLFVGSYAISVKIVRVKEL